MTITTLLKVYICLLYRDERPFATYQADGRAKASSHLYLVVFHHVGQHLPPVIAIRDGNGGDRGKPQVLQDVSQNKNGHNRATAMRNAGQL